MIRETPAAIALTRAGLPPRSVEIDGRPMSYADVGEGRVLLFLHGAACWSFTWRGVIARLCDGFRCVAPDLPGFGLSPADGSTPSVRAASNAVERFVERLDLRDVTLVANDSGGPAGFATAVRTPARFSAFVAVSTFGYSLQEFHRIRIALRLFTSAPGRMLNRTINLFPGAITRFGTPRKRWTAAERAMALLPFADRDARERCARMLRSLVDDSEFLRETEEGLQRISSRPLLAVFGEKDPARKAGFTRKFRGIFNDFTEEVVGGAMHFPQEDAPDEVAAAIRVWFEERVAGREGACRTGVAP